MLLCIVPISQMTKLTVGAQSYTSQEMGGQGPIYLRPELMLLTIVQNGFMQHALHLPGQLITLSNSLGIRSWGQTEGNISSPRANKHLL